MSSDVVPSTEEVLTVLDAALKAGDIRGAAVLMRILAVVAPAEAELILATLDARWEAP